MKELSIEEKAKAYDEAIKRLEDIKTGKCQKTFVFTEGLFDYIFPELRESEDWIPKEIIKYLKEKGDFRSCWIAWLEKQGEQKPTVEMKTPEGSLGIDYDTYNKIVDKCVYGEQNPAWNEEDERIYQSIIDDTVQENQLGDKQINWLESLKDRVQPQPKWNYNDEIIIGTIIQEIEKISSEKFIDNAKYRCLDWLRYRTKSLRPQSQWKPSDEQIEALDDVIDEYDGYPEFDSLVSLKNDLKKLMGE